jgi:ABC-type amino acid transport substrate-binding protein
VTMNPLLRTSAVPVALLIIGLSAIGLCSCRTDEPAREGETRSIRIGTDATFPPFEYRDSLTGELSGFDVDLARAVFALADLEVSFHVVHLDELIAGLNRNEFDCILSAYTMTAERREQATFSRPYYETGLVIVTRAGDSSVTGVADLVGKRLGVQRGSTGERLAKRIFRAEVFGYDSIGQAFRALDEAALHAVINDQPTSTLYTKDDPAVKMIDGQLERERYAAAFRKSDGWLIARFDSALTKFMDGPEFKALLLRHRLPIAGRP